MKPLDFFAKHPIFRFEEFASVHQKANGATPVGTKSTLRKHLEAQHLLHVRRGVYAVVPRGTSPAELQLDPYLVGSKLSPDAVIAYHSALQLHGRAHSLSRRVTFLTSTRTKPFEFRGTDFVPVSIPPVLIQLPDRGGGILEVSRQGLQVRATTLERALVDVLDVPRLGGGWEEIWRSLESVQFFDVDAVTEYALKLGSASTLAKVGFYLEQHREELMLEDKHLRPLAKRAPKQPIYLERSKREPGKLVRPWNLIVPERVINRSWGEVL
jgi:predicted transcriptional regulator of viral defense system